MYVHLILAWWVLASAGKIKMSMLATSPVEAPVSTTTLIIHPGPLQKPASASS